MPPFITTATKRAACVLWVASLLGLQASQAAVDAVDPLRAPLQRYLEIRGLSFTHSLPAIDPRLGVPTCASPLSVQPVDKSGLQVELSCPEGGWRRRFRFPPNGAQWAGRDGAEQSANAPSAAATPLPTLAPVAVSVATAAPASVRVWRTTAPLRRGESLDPAALEAVDVPAAKHQDALTEATNLASFSAVTNVARGTVLTTHLVRPAAVIARGETVTLLIKGRGFAISTEVVALEDAATGAPFKARNPSTGQEMKARAEGPGRGVIEKF